MARKATGLIKQLGKLTALRQTVAVSPRPPTQGSSQDENRKRVQNPAPNSVVSASAVT